jgi:UDP-3-O-[3-hydroxymyristoyl] N-acetylglucosamine deacetylase
MPVSQTIIKGFTLQGIGLHTGEASRVTVRPREGGGRVFRCGGEEIPALAEQVADTTRCTTLAKNGVQVRTVEHLLAALSLVGIDHAEIEVDGPELPILDGSAKAWLDAVRAAGIRTLGEDAPEYRITEPWWFVHGAGQFFLCPAEEPALYAAISVPETVAERMMAGGTLSDEKVSAQIARARTYALEAEVQALRDAGLARGGSLENAVVLTREGYLNEHVWPDEPAWHKVLDLAGDLALTGLRIRGLIVAACGGHRSQVALARAIRQSEKS